MRMLRHVQALPVTHHSWSHLIQEYEWAHRTQLCRRQSTPHRKSGDVLDFSVDDQHWAQVGVERVQRLRTIKSDQPDFALLLDDNGFIGAVLPGSLLLGFLLGAEFDVLAFLIKRYYGNAAYGRVYGVIFGLFYLGSGIGIWGLPKIRELSGNDYDNGLYVAAAILVASAVLMAFMPKYRYSAGHVAEAAATPAPQRA